MKTSPLHFVRTVFAVELNSRKGGFIEKTSSLLRRREQDELCISRRKMKDRRRINLPIASAEDVFINSKIWHRFVMQRQVNEETLK